MKRTIVASILGIAGSVALVGSSHAQGTVYFQNYTSSLNPVQINAPITFGSTGFAVTGGNGTSVAGNGVGKEFTADLLYSLNGGSTWTPLTFANSGATISGAFGYPAAFGYGSAKDGPITTPSGGNPGYFIGAGVKVPAYTSGSIEFIVEAYNGTNYVSSVGAGLWRGQSAPDVLSSIATGTTPTGYLTGLEGFTVSTIPEPATLAFAGLGLLSLLAIARRKKV